MLSRLCFGQSTSKTSLIYKEGFRLIFPTPICDGFLQRSPFLLSSFGGIGI